MQTLPHLTPREQRARIPAYADMGSSAYHRRGSPCEGVRRLAPTGVGRRRRNTREPAEDDARHGARGRALCAEVNLIVLRRLGAMRSMFAEIAESNVRARQRDAECVSLRKVRSK
jgi:hypothetical protein